MMLRPNRQTDKLSTIHFHVIALALLAVVFCQQPGFCDNSSLSIFGEPLSEAYKKDFFSFFRFTMTGMTVTKDGFTAVLFKPPRGSMLRQCVDLEMTLNHEGRIKRMKMKLRRRCIDDLRQGMFARDVAKSFIQAGIPEKDSDSINDLINEIFFRQKLTKIDVKPSEQDTTNKLPSITVLKLGNGELSDGDIIIFGENLRVPDLAKTPSALYSVFAGEIQNASQNIGELVLDMENEPKGDENLIMSILYSQDKEKMQKSDFDFDQLPGTAVPLLK